MKRLYDSKSKEPFKLSRTKIDMFLDCPRCFYLDRKMGVSQPSIPAFTLNSAVDRLLKKEFDILRKKGESHDLMKEYNIDAIPFVHEKMDEWRNNFKGVQYLHEPTNFLVFGAVDDIWIDKSGQLLVVDYKSTSTEKEISLDDKWKQTFKRQMEIYQWLLHKNGFKVSDMGYFVYCNGKTDRDIFNGRLEFDLQIIPHKGNDSWVENALIEAKKCLDSGKIPDYCEGCEYCSYVETASKKIPGRIIL